MIDWDDSRSYTLPNAKVGQFIGTSWALCTHTTKQSTQKNKKNGHENLLRGFSNDIYFQCATLVHDSSGA